MAYTNRYFARRAAVAQAAKQPKTECGEYWESPKGCCYRGTEDGQHSHYGDGSCDLEPCYRHGGPA